MGEHQTWIEQHLLDNDLSHQQRCDLLFAHAGIRVSHATMGRWVKRLGNTRRNDSSRQ